MQLITNQSNLELNWIAVSNGNWSAVVFFMILFALFDSFRFFFFDWRIDVWLADWWAHSSGCVTGRSPERKSIDPLRPWKKKHSRTKITHAINSTRSIPVHAKKKRKKEFLRSKCVKISIFRCLGHKISIFRLKNVSNVNFKTRILFF